MTMPNSARPFVLNWAPPGLGGASSSTHPAASSSTQPSSYPSTTTLCTNSASGNPRSGASSNSNNAAATDGAGGGGMVSPTSPLSPANPNVGAGGSAFTGFSGVGVGGGGFSAGVGGGVNGGANGSGANGAMNANGANANANALYPKEYSIFVGDLAPETSNSDLVAVFRNPVLGLRNDRAPKFIRPFASCKSAKIMLDPVTGVSRGYGFVRFTDEADQQRALIEMHGLYCLSRPMRISPATAKFKPPQPDLLPTSASAPSTYPAPGGYPSTTQLPPSVSEQQPHSVSAPIAVTGTTPVGYYPGDRTSQEYGAGLSTSASGEYYAQSYSAPQTTAPPPSLAPPPPPAAASTQQQGDEWRHTAQARAILGNLIGPNGEQLTSTDPYNTTVFVGGLSPLVGEDTLRTFFVPFGEIHYVKVPVGKHCGFVQFVRKADAERAIEKMQGFPVGGSRIRLSWGRSQYKAAQAAAQAAQAAALAQVQAQAQVQPPPPVPAPVVPANSNNPNANPSANANGVGVGGITPAMLEGMTHDQAVALLQKFQMQGFAALSNPPASANPYPPQSNPYSASAGASGSYGGANGNTSPEAYRNGFHSSSPSNGNVVADAYNVNNSANGGAPHFTDEALKMRRGEEAPFGYPSRGAYEVPTPSSASASTATGGATSFSPFSPDPNQHQQGQHQHQQPQFGQQQHGHGAGAGALYAAAEMLGKRRDSYATGLPHPSKAYAPGFFPVGPTLQTGGASKGVGMASSGSSSPTRGGYSGGGFAAGTSPPAFQVNRYQGHAPHPPISRPTSGSARPGSGQQQLQHHQQQQRGEYGLDAMHDLNGTLASLDLEERAWGLKSPTVTEASVGGESTSTSLSGSTGTSGSSGGSVQFRMTMESP
ncbi:hypothetical protein C8R45DRAFT_501390 [Mycena sanguinolenta]|nr:hypothetical protein C8R45DRAFT_501390 [Mycena sanguinolenta]